MKPLAPCEGICVGLQLQPLRLLLRRASAIGKTTESTEPDKRLSFFGVYDGHGGDKVAIYTGYSCNVNDPVDHLLREPADAFRVHGPCSFTTEDPLH